MRYSTLPTKASSRDMIQQFGGYNHNMRIGSGEFYDMKNLTSTYYPLLAPRQTRGFYTGGGSINGMIAKDQLCYVDGKDFVIGSQHIDMGLTDGEKTLVSMGAYVVIWPDRKYINTVDIEDRGAVEATMETSGNARFSLCNVNAESYDVTYISDKEPSLEQMENIKYWLDTSAKPHQLKQYSTATGMWVSLATTYIKIESTGIGKLFEKGDGVEISGLKDTQLTLIDGTAFTDDEIAAIDGSFVIQAKEDNYIVIVGMLSTIRTISNKITVSRTMPEMDFVIESGNRLWGCRYGLDAKGEYVNQIYASKLGDFKNWKCFEGVSTDSYYANCGTDGSFTGAVTHLGYPLFFKEECMHKVYGSYPAQYQIQTTSCRGVQKGSHKSLAIVGEILYYKSRLGVCAFDGSLPTEISGNLGDVAYSQAVAGAHGSKYYITMKDTGGTYHLFVYDASKGLWHKEDNLQAKCFCSHGNEMYYLDCATGQIRTMLGSGTPLEKQVEWMAQTGLLCVDDPDKKYISRLQIRMQLEPESTVKIYMEYDSSGEWEYVCTMKGTDLRSFNLPVKPRRCDHMKLKMEGKGNARVFSISKTVEQGSGY